MTFSFRACAHISTYYAALGWFKAFSRRLYILSKFISRAFNNFSLLRSWTYSLLGQLIHNRSLRDGDLIRIPAHRSELASRYFGARLWNSLPLHILTSSSHPSFNFLLRPHLLVGVEILAIKNHSCWFWCDWGSRWRGWYFGFNWKVFILPRVAVLLIHKEKQSK